MTTIYTYNLLIPKYLNDESLINLSLVSKYWLNVTHNMRQHRLNKKEDIKKLFYQLCMSSLLTLPSYHAIGGEQIGIIDKIASGKTTFGSFKKMYIIQVHHILEKTFAKKSYNKEFVNAKSILTLYHTSVDEKTKLGMETHMAKLMFSTLTYEILGFSLLLDKNENNVNEVYSKIIIPWLIAYCEKYYM